MLSILAEMGGVIIVGSSPTKQLRVNWEGGQESLWFPFTDRLPTNLYSQRGFSDTSVSKDCNSPAIHIALQGRGEEKKRGAVRTGGGEEWGSRTCQGRFESEVTRWKRSERVGLGMQRMRERANLMKGMGRESGAGREGAGFGDKWELEEI